MKRNAQSHILVLHRTIKIEKKVNYYCISALIRILEFDDFNYHIRYKIMCCTYHMYHHDRGLCYQLCIQNSGSAVLLINFPPI